MEEDKLILNHNKIEVLFSSWKQPSVLDRFILPPKACAFSLGVLWDTAPLAPGYPDGWWPRVSILVALSSSPIVFLL